MTSITWADEAHTIVKIVDQYGDTFSVPAGWPGEFRKGNGVADILALLEQEEPDAYVAPEPGIVTPHLNNGGLARFSGAAPASMLESIHMAGVTRVTKGRYRATHETPMPSDQYSAIPAVFDALPRNIRITARTAAYVEVRVTDIAGAAQDATEVTVKTERVVNS